MILTNTLTKQKEELTAKSGEKIKMFVCGPTVYDYIHIGNARTFVFFDIVAKYLKHKGYQVDYIQNITDIDNKIIERATKEGMDSLEYAKKYTEIFKQDMLALGVTSPEYKNATDHIPEVIKQVQTLLDKNNAYVIQNDGIYFDLSTFPDYGKLSGRTAEMADDAVSRIDDSNKKRNRGDFALWKFSQAGDPSWPAPFGDGRPGWHIEDTAITERYFGPQYDIHGGGQDLMFPHHEAEIAQQESASGLKPFVKYWLHVAFLITKEAKMSKSLGNFETAHELLKKYSPEAIRFYLLSAHHKTPLDFDEKLLNQSAAAVRRIKEFADKLSLANGQAKVCADIDATESKFYSSLDDDFNTAAAFGSLFELIGKVNPLIVSNELNKTCAQKISKLLSGADEMLGIIPKKEEKIPEEVTRLIEEREKYRQDKNFAEADKIRSQIESLGYKIEDTIYGPLAIKN